MNGREKALIGVDFRTAAGVEIGPLTRPLVTRDQGEIYYIDRATTEELKAAYANQLDVSKIVEVDYVWGSATLAECVNGRRFDYCLASHVVEHVPDLINWLNEVSDILKPGGVLSLIIPDKRYTFDVLRPVSTLAETVEAYMRRFRRPTFKQVFEHFSSYVEVDAAQLWGGGRSTCRHLSIGVTPVPVSNSVKE